MGCSGEKFFGIAQKLLYLDGVAIWMPLRVKSQPALCNVEQIRCSDDQGLIARRYRLSDQVAAIRFNGVTAIDSALDGRITND